MLTTIPRTERSTKRVRTQRASKIRRLIGSTGALPLAFTAWRTLREWSPKLFMRNRQLRREFALQTPIPPSSLVFSATGSRDVDWFLSSGGQTAGALRGALDSIGRPIESFSGVFEWGCGCGRVLRQWSSVDGPHFSASDYNPRGVEWCRSNLGFVSLRTNNLAPPLAFDTGSFDLCYAISVFTHLPEILRDRGYVSCIAC
jgi:methyltransferase family protein